MSESFTLNLSEASPMTLTMINRTTPLRLAVAAGGGNANVMIDTKENWERKIEYIPKKGTIVIYSNRNVADGVNYPGIKIGDGLAYLADLPFLGDEITATIMGYVDNHIENSDVHVSQNDRTYWDNKLDCVIDEETLVLAPIEPNF